LDRQLTSKPEILGTSETGKTRRRLICSPRQLGRAGQDWPISS
jgi:hypothetical protein